MTSLEQLKVDWTVRYFLAPVGSDWEQTCLHIVCVIDEMLEMEQAA